MTLKILQWNIWYKEKSKNIVRVLKKVDADIICVQEIIQHLGKNIDIARDIANKLGYNYFYKEAETWSNRDIKENQGNAIYSKLPILNKTYKYVQKPKHNPPDATNEGRVYIEIEVNWNKQAFTIGTTHLSYSHRFKITPHRKKEIDKLVDIVKCKKSSYIFAGDLNSVPAS